MSKASFHFELGDHSKPRGNCFIYCAVVNDQYYFPEAQWIASNVYVSFQPINQKLPVVTFPPTAMDEMQDIFRIAQLRSMDVLRIDDFTPPDNQEEAKNYFQDRVDEFHAIVMAYVELCREMLNQFDKEKAIDFQTEIQKLDTLEMRFIDAWKKGKRSSFEKVLGPYTRDQIISDNRFDFQNLWVLYHEQENQIDELIRLFFQKFKAVYWENYEQAVEIQQQIDQMVKQE